MERFEIVIRTEGNQTVFDVYSEGHLRWKGLSVSGMKGIIEMWAEE